MKMAKLDKYATTDSPEYKELVERIRARFGLTSLKFNTLETLIELSVCRNARCAHTVSMVQATSKQLFLI